MNRASAGFLFFTTGVSVAKKQSGLPKETEREFQKQVIELAQLKGWKVAHFRPARVIRNGKETWRTPVEGDGAGFPDLVLARNGVVIFAELKTDAGTVSAEQQDWLRETRGFVWRPANWHEILRLLM